MSEVSPSKVVTRWKCVGYCVHCTADSDESTFSREWGHFEKSDDGVWVRADSALAEIERLRAALKSARPCVRNELNRCELQIMSQKKAPAGAHDPLKYIEALETEANQLNQLLDTIDALSGETILKDPT